MATSWAMTPQINNEIFADYLECQCKAYLKLHNTAGHKTDYERLMDRQDAIYRSAALKKLQKDYSSKDILHIAGLTPSSLKQGCSLIVDASVEIGGLRSAFHAVKISAKAPSVYEPILCCRFRKIARKQKLLLAYMAIVLGHLQGKLPTHGFIIYGNKLSTSEVLLKHYVSKADAILQALNAQLSATDEIHPFLNDHCDICEYSQHCTDKALDCDHLSLLRGISIKEIKRQNDRGIFTVHQLSYTFRPRKTPKRAKNPGKPRYFSLQALALRENSIYLHELPDLPTAETMVFLILRAYSSNQGQVFMACLFSAFPHLVYEPSVSKTQIAADMFEIVNKAILVHPLFQGYVDSYSRLLKEAGPF